MVVDNFEYKGNIYTVITNYTKDKVFETKIFTSKKEIYCSIIEDLTEANGRHMDIKFYPELYISEELKENKESTFAEWIMAEDSYEDGREYSEYPHCSNCNRGVYKHDAGSFCPFCGTPMKNPMS